MQLELEQAQIMFKLARKGNWGASYDREEHFKRFQNLDEAVKDLENKGWIMRHKKSYKTLCLNPKFKREIIEFIEREMPYLKGMVK